MIRSLRVRLTLLFTGIFAGFLVLLATWAHLSSFKRLWREFDREIRRDGELAASLYLEELGEFERGEHGPEWRKDVDRAAAAMDLSVAVYEAPDRRVFQTPDLDPIPPRSAVPAPGSRDAYRSMDFPSTHRPGMRRLVYFTFTEPGRPPMTFEAARRSGGLETYLRRQFYGLAIAVPALVALGAMAGLAFVRRALKPVEQMAALARDISAGDLSRRVPLPDSEGELRALATTLNGMLARLEDSFDRMRDFTSDAAHELRSPIQTIRTALESSIDHPPEQLREAVGDALEELGLLGETVEKLLLLAKADAGRLLATPVRVNVEDLARQVVEANGIYAEARGIRIRLETAPLEVLGDAALLRRAIHNLVDNGVRHGREDGSVVVRVGPEGVEVEDDGPGIAADHLPFLFRRFFRADPARSDRVTGTGLGLSIVKTITEAHGGSVSVESRPGRTVFRLRFTTGRPQPAAVSG